MIHNDEEYESALERALSSMSEPPLHDSAEEDELFALLHDIRDYTPAPAGPQKTDTQLRAERLLAKAQALSDHVEASRMFTDRMSDGFRGIENSVTGKAH